MQSMPSLPAWSLWLKAIGCLGACTPNIGAAGGAGEALRAGGADDLGAERVWENVTAAATTTTAKSTERERLMARSAGTLLVGPERVNRFVNPGTWNAEPARGQATAALAEAPLATLFPFVPRGQEPALSG